MKKWDKDALTACIGKTATQVYGLAFDSDNTRITFDDGSTLSMCHPGDYSDVRIAQVDGEAKDLLGSVLLMAEIISSDETPELAHKDDEESHTTWTFVKFGTVKGYVTVRWLGESNGFYSEAPNISLEVRS